MVAADIQQGIAGEVNAIDPARLPLRSIACPHIRDGIRHFEPTTDDCFLRDDNRRDMQVRTFYIGDIDRS